MKVSSYSKPVPPPISEQVINIELTVVEAGNLRDLLGALNSGGSNKGPVGTLSGELFNRLSSVAGPRSQYREIFEERNGVPKIKAGV